MNSAEFVIWLRGFTEACHEFHPTPKQWDRLKEVLHEVEDNDDENLEFEPEDWYGAYEQFKTPLSGSGTITVPNFWSGDSPSINFTVTSGSSGNTNISATVWNDKMGCWHYTNYPEGFGYYHNQENKKQQLND